MNPCCIKLKEHNITCETACERDFNWQRLQNGKRACASSRSAYKRGALFRAVCRSAGLTMRWLGLLSLSCSIAVTSAIARPNLSVLSSKWMTRICDDRSDFKKGVIMSPEQVFDSPGQSNYENLRTSICLLPVRGRTFDKEQM